MIANLALEEFAQILHAYLIPAALPPGPDQSVGGDAPVGEIEQALQAPGRTIFIYGNLTHGNPGAGKTSLAKTVAAHQTSGHDPVNPTASSAPMITVLIREAARASKDSGVDTSHNLRREQGSSAADAIDRNEFIALVIKAGEQLKEDTAVVIDEFDQITSNEERTRFANFIRQLEDRRVALRFIFCGVSDGLRKLLEGHESRYSYVENVKAPRPSEDARFEIIGTEEALKTGVPHYVDLVSEHLFWEMFNDPTFAGSLR